MLFIYTKQFRRHLLRFVALACLVMGTGCTLMRGPEQPFAEPVDDAGFSQRDGLEVHTVNYQQPEDRGAGVRSGDDAQSVRSSGGTNDYLEEHAYLGRARRISHEEEINIAAQSEQIQIVRLPSVEEEGEFLGSDMHLGNIFASIRSDYGNYYSIEPMANLLLATGIAATLANTGADESLQDILQGNTANQRSSDYTNWIKEAKVFGEGTWQVPIIYAGIAATGFFFEEGTFGSYVGHWGQRSLRTLVVGWPPMIFMQHLTGASRPGESASGSIWRPFEDTNGVSGHSFMGAIPFLTAAQMVDNRYIKVILYTGSTLTAFSRVIDGDHYTSQAFLGWTMAFIAANAVDESITGRRAWSVFPWTYEDSVGIGIDVIR